jgi:hypothetical protein
MRCFSISDLNAVSPFLPYHMSTIRIQGYNLRLYDYRKENVHTKYYCVSSAENSPT